MNADFRSGNLEKPRNRKGISRRDHQTQRELSLRQSLPEDRRDHNVRVRGGGHCPGHNQRPHARQPPRGHRRARVDDGADIDDVGRLPDRPLGLRARSAPIGRGRPRRHQGDSRGAREEVHPVGRGERDRGRGHPRRGGEHKGEGPVLGDRDLERRHRHHPTHDDLRDARGHGADEVDPRPVEGDEGRDPQCGAEDE
jgi:hypothetical protein